MEGGQFGQGSGQSVVCDPRFVLDVHLGKLAYHLRMLGFDTLYRNDYRNSDLIVLSTTEGRILLSKDHELLENAVLTRAYRVQQIDPRLQLIEVMRHFSLSDLMLPFTRCLLCNHQLRPVDKDLVLHRLPEKVRGLFDEFQLCSQCDRVYWRGTHFEKMSRFIEGVVRELILSNEPKRSAEGGNVF